MKTEEYAGHDFRSNINSIVETITICIPDHTPPQTKTKECYWTYLEKCVMSNLCLYKGCIDNCIPQNTFTENYLNRVNFQ